MDKFRHMGEAGLIVLLVLAVHLPATTTADDAVGGRLKVFILAGQSNMEGHGTIALDPQRNGGKGSLEYLVRNPATADRFQHLNDVEGEWVVRSDVWIWYLGRKGPLTVGYGARERGSRAAHPTNPGEP